jgi:hypothetical protein
MRLVGASPPDPSEDTNEFSTFLDLPEAQEEA